VLLAVSVGAKLQELVDNFFFAGLKFIFCSTMKQHYIQWNNMY
jgi:hypothetical protein